jgi:hypothetical protein
VVHDEPPAPELGERYGDLVESLTDLARTLTETESVRDTLRSILALAVRSIPGCHAASITVLDATEQPSTIAATAPFRRLRHAVIALSCSFQGRSAVVAAGWQAKRRLCGLIPPV